MNELLLLVSVLVYFGGIIPVYKFFGRVGVHAWIVIVTILCNIEVLVLVNAFGMEQTLGNVSFAATFLATDLLSERYGKKDANLAVWMGIAASVAFTSMALMTVSYIPSINDWAMPSIQAILTPMPRILISGLAVYFLVQFLDVYLYHRIWDVTTSKLFKGQSKAGLWIRNQGATYISQFFNSALFTIFAFWGVFEIPTLIEITISTYLIYLVLAVLDAPFLYFLRSIKPLNE